MKNLFFQEDYLTLILTLECNLNCSFCPIEKKRVSLNFRTAQKAIDFFLSLKGDSKRIKFFGGEPLLEFELLKKIIFFSESKARGLNKEVKFVLTTNGLLLNNKILKFLEEHGIELILSSHHFKNIEKNKIIPQLINFPKISLNIDIPPQKVRNLCSELTTFYKKGFNRFNLLPVYYVLWSNEKLDILAQEIEKIKDFCVKNPDIYFINQDLIGEVPLFNSCYTIDARGDIFGSNIVLFKEFKKLKNLFFLGNVFKKQNQNENKISLKEIIEKKLNKNIFESTLAADELINNFVNSIIKLDRKNQQISFKKADIKVGYSCNNNCKFCVQGEKRGLYPDKRTEELKKIMRDARKSCQTVVFTGGEPTVRPDFLELAAYAKSLGFKRIQAQSNGRMFAYKKFCRETIKAGVNEFALALHGHIPKLHNYLTSTESFYQIVQGVKNLKKLDQVVITNTVITKSNYRHLPEIAKLLVSLHVNQFQFAFVHPLGNAQENFSSIVPRMLLIMPYVKKGLDVGIGAKINVMTEGIPCCLMQGYENYIAEKIIPATDIYELDTKIDFEKLRPTVAKMKGKDCKECKFFNVCEGPWREYPEKFGFFEFKPVK
jgi:radical SAM protein with 4Fe4S-binding SPASM domain